EDLWPFNEERVARAIVASRLPVIAAVGHEVDFTIACLVADRRAPTPTAAAEMVVPRVVDLEARVARCAGALGEALARRRDAERRRVAALAGRVRAPRRYLRALRGRVDGAARTVETAVHRLQLQHPVTRLARVAEAVEDGRRRLERAVAAVVRDGRARVARGARSLDDLSPLAVLQRGYSLT